MFNILVIYRRITSDRTAKSKINKWSELIIYRIHKFYVSKYWQHYSIPTVGRFAAFVYISCFISKILKLIQFTVIVLYTDTCTDKKVWANFNSMHCFNQWAREHCSHITFGCVFILSITVRIIIVP